MRGELRSSLRQRQICPSRPKSRIELFLPPFAARRMGHPAGMMEDLMDASAWGTQVAGVQSTLYFQDGSVQQDPPTFTIYNDFFAGTIGGVVGGGGSDSWGVNFAKAFFKGFSLNGRVPHVTRFCYVGDEKARVLKSSARGGWPTLSFKKPAKWKHALAANIYLRCLWQHH